MKSILNILGRTVVGCVGAGVMFGVWDALKTYAATEATRDAYNEGYERGVEVGKLYSKKDEEESN